MARPSHLKTFCTSTNAMYELLYDPFVTDLMGKMTHMTDNQSYTDPKTRHVNILPWGAIVGFALQLFISGSGIPKLQVVALILGRLNQHCDFLVGLQFLRECRGTVGAIAAKLILNCCSIFAILHGRVKDIHV